MSYDDDKDPDCWWTATICKTPKRAGIPDDISTCPEPHTWGFTLDDGPNCSHNAYFDYLNSIEQKASLFYVGSNVLDWPLEAQRGLGDGHEVSCGGTRPGCSGTNSLALHDQICAHSWSHPYMFVA